MRKTDLEEDRNWVHVHIDDLADYGGNYIAVVDRQVVGHGTDVFEVIRLVKQRGFTAPLVTRIENGKHIDVYEIIPGFEVQPLAANGDRA